MTAFTPFYCRATGHKELPVKEVLFQCILNYI